MTLKKELEARAGQWVVLDTRSTWVYIGRLEKVSEDCIVLSDADAHDNRDTATTKEIYIYESRKTGVRANRNRVLVDIRHVVGVSLLEDVRLF